VSSAWRKTRTLLSVNYAYMLEYRAELVLWMLSGVLPFVLMGVWMEAGREGAFPLTPPEFARYFLAVFLVRQLTVVWVIWQMDELVVTGRLSPWLLQPIDPFWRMLAEHVAERAARLPFVVALVVLFFVLYPQAWRTPDPASLALGLVATAAAFALRFLMEYTLGTLSFWLERAGNLQQLWFLALLFLSGAIAPLEVYPPLVRSIVELTPFPYVVYFPAQLLAGQPVAAARGLAVLAVWTALFIVINRWVWHMGLRKYSAMGA